MALMDLIEFVDEHGCRDGPPHPRAGLGRVQGGLAADRPREPVGGLLPRRQGLRRLRGRAGTLWPPRTSRCSPRSSPPRCSATRPFRTEVFFVSQRTFTDLKWGTAEPILFRDSEFKMIRLRANGIYTFQIIDPKLFVVKIVGTRGIFTNYQIEDFLRGIIIGRLADILGETLDSVLDLPRYFDELGAGLKARDPRRLRPVRAGDGRLRHQRHHPARGGAEAHRRALGHGSRRRHGPVLPVQGRAGHRRPGQRRGGRRGGGGDGARWVQPPRPAWVWAPAPGWA